MSPKMTAIRPNCFAKAVLARPRGILRTFVGFYPSPTDRMSGREDQLPLLPEWHELPQIDGERFLDLRPSQRSGRSSTKGAGERSGAVLTAGASSVLGVFPFLVTLRPREPDASCILGILVKMIWQEG